MLKTIKSSAVAAAAGIILVASPAAVLAKNDNNGNSNAGNKVTICHATGSQTNPYVAITPNVNGIVNGHESHQDSRDIIPSFQYNDHGVTKTFAGQNLDNGGQAILNNGCVVTAGQGGGGGTTSSTTNTQVLGSNVTGGQGAGQVGTVPQGSVNGGGGAASSTVSKASAIGLLGSLLSAGGGLALLNRRQS